MYMINKRFHKGSLLFLAIAITTAAIISGCSDNDDNEIVIPTVTYTPTPTLSPTPTNTPTPSPTLSPTPTSTPTPSPTPVRQNTLYSIYEEKYDKSYTLDIEYQDFLYEMCVKYKISEHYELIMAQMYHESRFNPNAYSGTNDYGLMQINIQNHDWLSEKFGKSDFFDPYLSIESGVYMMSQYLEKYDDVQKALVCYNSGESKVKQGTYSTSYSCCVVEDMNKLVELEQ